MNHAERIRCLIILCFTFSLNAQIRPGTIYGDYNGYWISRDNSSAYTVSQDTNNLIGFTIGTTTYATGVNNAALTSHGVTYVNENYRAFPTTINTTSTATNFFIGIPRYVNGVMQNQTCTPSLSCNISLGYYLRDGVNGLDLSTAVFNIPK